MPELCDLQISINGQHTFFVNEKIMSKFSDRLQKIVTNQENSRKTQIKNLEMEDLPGGPSGFELITRFCYGNGGGISITISNVSILHCCSVYLGMTEKISRTNNLFERTETFLEGMFYWSWHDILICLRSCDCFSDYADSIGLLQKLICSLLEKIAQNSPNFSGLSSTSPSSSSSSPETNSGKSSSSKQAWWFDDLTTLPPNIIEKFIKTLGCFGSENNSLTLTRFLIHYLKNTLRIKKYCSRSKYGGLADTAVYGVNSIGKSAFSCRGLFLVLRIVMSGFGLSKECRIELERLIGQMLDKATLDDLLVSSNHDDGCAYDVNLVSRLIKVFVNDSNYDELDHISEQKMKKVGKLIDKYLREISPDHNLKLTKFLGISESLPDSARDCFDGVYRAVDIYLETHPTLSVDEQARLCRCLNYEKLSLEACKDLARNPRISPRIAVEALISQQSKVSKTEDILVINGVDDHEMIFHNVVKNVGDGEDMMSLSEGESTEYMRLNLQRMQWRVIQLEKVCKDMKAQMSGFVKNTPVNHNTRGLPRLC